MTPDTQLLADYSKTRDAVAFAELVRRYAGTVYGTCLRMTGNRQDAEDVTQECFTHLAQSVEDIRESLPGWLHTVAMRRSANAVRAKVRRRGHEQEAGRMQKKPSADDSTWQEMVPHLDAALAELPADTREILIRHFLQGISQEEIAAHMQVNQSTVSRRIGRGIEELRGKLKKAGLVLTAAALTACLADNAAVAAPAALTATLGKMAMLGVGKTVAGTTATIGGLTMAKATALSILAAGILVTSGLLLARADDKPEVALAPPAPAKATDAPPPPNVPAPPTDDGSRQIVTLGATLTEERVLFGSDDVAWINPNKYPYWLQARLSPNGNYLLHNRVLLEEVDGQELYGFFLMNVKTGKETPLPLRPVPSSMNDVFMRMDPFDPKAERMVLTDTADTPDAMEIVLFDMGNEELKRTGIKGRFPYARFNVTGTELILSELRGRGICTASLPDLEIKELDSTSRPPGFPVSVCPTENIVCFFGVVEEGIEPQRIRHVPPGMKLPPPRPHLRGIITLFDLDKRADFGRLPTHPDNSTLDDVAPQWTPDGRYICYYDREGNEGTKSIGARIWDRIEKKEVAFVANAVPIGPGPEGAYMVLVSLSKDSPHAILYNAATGRTQILGHPSLRPLHAAGGLIAYLKTLPDGKQEVCVARIIAPKTPATP